jgi:hypothetical protein
VADTAAVQCTDLGVEGLTISSVILVTAHTQTIIDTIQKETATDQQQHSFEKHHIKKFFSHDSKNFLQNIFYTFLQILLT